MTLSHPCVCCGYRTLSAPPGSHEICPLCGWEDDVHQLRWPYRAGGSNASSLIDAQRAAAVSGADADHEREPSWRPVGPRDRFEPRGRLLAPWPEDRTVLYWWRHRPRPAWWDSVTPVEPILDDGDGDARAAAFAEAVREAAEAAPPADPDNLSGMSIDFDHYLWSCPAVREVRVTSGADPARQLTAVCTADPAASPGAVGEQLVHVWTTALQYGFWEAHLLRIMPGSVVLDVVTRPDPDSYYITGRIVARWPS